MTNLTEAQRAAVRTWRRGRLRAIVSDLPFAPKEEPLTAVGAESYGGQYYVLGSLNDTLTDFILDAAHAAAGPEYHKNEDGERWACDKPKAKSAAEDER